MTDKKRYIPERDVQTALNGAKVGRPAPFGHNGHNGHNPETPRVTSLDSVCASDVNEKPLRWLWSRYIPMGKASIVDGEPDKGKSQVLLDLAARVTQGQEMPDGSRCQLGGSVDVVIMSSEDDIEDTIVPRLRLAGADLSRVHIIRSVTISDGSKELPTIPRDVPLLREKIKQTNAKLVIVDPLAGYLDAKIDSHNDASVRRALNALHTVASETGAAIIGIRHYNKNSHESNPLHRGGGSIAIIGFARSALAIVADPDPQRPNRRYFGVAKHNLGPVGTPTLAYEVVPVDTTIAGESVQLSRVQWQGFDSRTVKQLLEESVGGVTGAERRSTAALCYQIMTELLADEQEHRATEIEDALLEAAIPKNVIATCRKTWVDRGELVLKKRGGQGKGKHREPFHWTWRMVMPHRLGVESAVGAQGRNEGHEGNAQGEER